MACHISCGLAVLLMIASTVLLFYAYHPKHIQESKDNLFLVAPSFKLCENRESLMDKQLEIEMCDTHVDQQATSGNQSSGWNPNDNDSKIKVLPVSMITKRVIESEIVNTMEKKFLSLLGMRRKPKTTGDRSGIPKELLDLYKTQTQSSYPTTDLFLPGKFTRSANTVRVLKPIDFKTAEYSCSEFNSIIKFDVSSIPVNEQVTGAELKVPFSFIHDPIHNVNKEKFRNNISMIDASFPFVRVLMLDIVKLNTNCHSDGKDGLESFSYPTDSKLINLSNRKQTTFWLTFDVYPAISRWLDSKNEKIRAKLNQGLAIKMLKLTGDGKVMDSGGNETFVNIEVAQTKPSKLIIYSDDGHNAKTRTKRDAKSISRKFRAAYHQHYHHYHHHHRYFQNHPPRHYTSQPQFYRQPNHNHHGRRRKPHRFKNRKRNLCSRKPMFVDFTDVGWNDWIVAPPGYQAYYCSGECRFPLSEHMNATNHAVIQALISSMNPSLVPSPCCVPNKYSSLSLLYTDSSDRIVLKNYNEMIVDSCGCS